MDWIDVALTAFLAFGAWNGWRRGLIVELTGFLALAAALVTGFCYRGQLDGLAAGLLHLGAGSAHVAGLLATAALAYLVVWGIGMLADRVAKLPFLNLANRGLGAGLAIVKTLLVLVVVDYIATFAPLSPDLHDDLARSFFAGRFATVDTAIDDAIGRTIPPYLEPVWSFATQQHRYGGV